MLTTKKPTVLSVDIPLYFVLEMENGCSSLLKNWVCAFQWIAQEFFATSVHTDDDLNKKMWLIPSQNNS